MQKFNGYTDLISIIVPVYNVEKYIENCLDSLLKQTYENFEIILIDDGSTDSSLTICGFYELKDPRVVVYSQKNQGVSIARNRGLSIAKGSYITFVDSDDIVDSRYLEILYRNIKTENADISMCTWTHNITSAIDDKSIITWNVEETFFQYLRAHIINGNVYAKLYKRRILENVKFKEKLRIGEDQIFVIQAIERSRRIVFQNIPLYFYLVRESSVMNLMMDSRYWDNVYRAEWMVNEAKNNLPVLKGLFRKEELNIYVILMIRDIKEHTKESKKIANYVFPRIKSSKNFEFIKYSTKYEFIRYFFIKYFYSIAKIAVKIKNLLS